MSKPDQPNSPRHAHLKAQWQQGQKWETLVDGASIWVPVSDGGYAEPTWDHNQEYRQAPPGVAVPAPAGLTDAQIDALLAEFGDEDVMRGFTVEQTRERVRAVLAGVAPSHPTTLERFNESADLLKDESPLERLRYFLSLALSGQDWLDVEPFLDALGVAPCAAPGSAGRVLPNPGSPEVTASEYDSMVMRSALRQIAAMDQKGLRGDDLGRAARIARGALADPYGLMGDRNAQG